MGYSTEFKGNFRINKILDDKTKKLLVGLETTRRMRRDIIKLAQSDYISLDMAVSKWGREGQFYFGDDTESILDVNTPPICQPSLWCQWRYVERYGKGYLEWNGGEKFYNYANWLKYLIEEILVPRGYVLNGEVHWQGELVDDRGILRVVDNILEVIPKIKLYNHYRYVLEPVMKPVTEADFKLSSV